MQGLMRVLRTLGVCLGLFLATYVPTFVLVHLLSLSPVLVIKKSRTPKHPGFI